ncbi:MULTISPECIES: hypothetical protein [unclassified Carboxylicivirga]|uniref:hypothetical protein n=1 Tax=Carboxylicivirga TaxID=1628153 RepID=UPI003D32994D
MEKKYLYYSGSLLIFILIIIGVSYLLIESKIDNQYSKINSQVENILQKEYNINSIKPFILIPQRIDSTGNYFLDSTEIATIESHISKYYQKAYHSYYDSILACKDYSPFLILPNNSDKYGNIVLKKEDLDNIEKHLNSVIKSVDDAIKETKYEIDNDIDRLNLWLTAWIAAMGFIGIVLPIVINQVSSKELKEESKAIREKADGLETDITRAKTDASSAKTTATETKEEIKSQKEELERITNKIKEEGNKLDEVEKRFNNIEAKFKEKDRAFNELEDKLSKKEEEIMELFDLAENAKKDSETANSFAKEALLKTEEQNVIIKHLSSLNKLKSLDFHRIAYHNNGGVNQYFAYSFKGIKDGFENFRLPDNASEEIKNMYQEIVRDYVFSFYEVIRFLDDRGVIHNMENLTDLLLSYLKDEKLDVVDKIVEALDSAIQSLEKK